MIRERASMLPYTYIAPPVITEMESVYCAVRIGFLNKTYYVASEKGSSVDINTE
jgi:hypothetical protein